MSGGNRLFRNSILLKLALCLLVLIISCKEEAIIEQNQQKNSATQSTLAKKSDLSSVQADS